MLNPDQLARLKTVTAETLGVDEEDLQPDSSPQTLPSWTSFSHLTLMGAVEDAFGCTFSMEDMAGVADFDALCDLVSRHVG